jgi:hypothetical protein
VQKGGSGASSHRCDYSKAVPGASLKRGCTGLVRRVRPSSARAHAQHSACDYDETSENQRSAWV